MEVGCSLGPETREREYKEFIIDTDEHNIQEHILPNTESSIVNYVEKYVKRYFASMSRTESDKKYAELYIGVHDNGTVTGIPFDGSIGELYELIKNTIDVDFQDNVRGIYNNEVNNDVITMYYNKMAVDVIRLDVPFNIMTKNNENIQESLDIDRMNLKKWEKQVKLYRTIYDNYLQSCSRYAKLIDILNTPSIRNEVVMYCYSNNAPSYIIELLLSNTFINIDKGVSLIKKDNTTIEFWVTEFKEYVLLKHYTEYKKHKLPPPYRNTTTKLFKKPYNTYGWWQEEIPVYLIKIILPLNIEPTKWIEYRDKNEWVSRRRIYNGNGPSCEIMNN